MTDQSPTARYRPSVPSPSVTYTAAMHAIFTAIAPDRRTVIVFCPNSGYLQSYKQDILNALELLGLSAKVEYHKIILDNGSRIVFISNPHQIQGYKADEIVLDTAGFVPIEQIEALLASKRPSTSSWSRCSQQGTKALCKSVEFEPIELDND